MRIHVDLLEFTNNFSTYSFVNFTIQVLGSQIEGPFEEESSTHNRQRVCGRTAEDIVVKCGYKRHDELIMKIRGAIQIHETK